MAGRIEVRDARLAFGAEPALRGVTVTIAPGERVAIAGPSGCGKSTLLMCLAGVLVPDSGQVLVDGQDLTTLSEDERADLRARRYGFVMQFGDLVDELTLAENVRLARLISGRRGGSPTALLDRLGVGELADRLPAQVSGGQRQRVAVARAVGGSPSVVLADEPTGALDSQNSEVVMDLLLEQARLLPATLVVVTHDERFLPRFDRVIRMLDGQVVGC